MWLRASYQEALVELEKTAQLAAEEWSLLFWKGIVHLSLKQEEEAVKAIEMALEKGMPPVLLAPLRWFKQDFPNFHDKYIVPLEAKYDQAINHQD
jgi:hypothetical protein